MEGWLRGHSITAVVFSLSSSDSPKSRVHSESHASSVCLSGLPYFLLCDKIQLGNKLCSSVHISVRLFILISSHSVCSNLNHCDATEEVHSVSIKVVALGPNNLLGWNIRLGFWVFFPFLSVSYKLESPGRGSLASTEKEKCLHQTGL